MSILTNISDNIPHLGAHIADGINSIRSAGASLALKTCVNAVILKGLGTMSTLQIDGKTKVIKCSLDLEGEKEPVDASISYEIDKANGVMKLKTLTSSRKWIETLFDKFVGEEMRSVKLPDKAMTALKVAGLA